VASGEAARRYDPTMGSDAGFNLSFSYYLKGRFRDAAQTSDAAALRTPDIVFLEAVRAMSHAQLGEEAEARAAAARVRRVDPFFKRESFGLRLVNPAHRRATQEGLAKAGL
jgi:hypothetical protein